MASKFLSLDQKCRKLSSAHCSIPGSDPEQWLWEGGTCVQTPGNMDRKWTERSKQLLLLPSSHQAGENKQSLFFITTVYHFGKEMQAGNANHNYPLTSSTLHFLHSTWHPSILPHLSSPGPTSIFLNSTSDLLESKCIPRDAPRIQGHSLPAPSFTPDYTWTTSLRPLHFLVPKEEDCVLKAVY